MTPRKAYAIQSGFDLEKIDLSFRISSLKKFKETILKYENDLYKAIDKDLNKTSKEFYLSEMNEVLCEIDYHIQNLKKWIKPIKVKSTFQTLKTKSQIFYQPVGRVLIISPFNYPFNLAFMPLIGSISAGNQSLLKLSDQTINVNKVMYKIIDEAFEKNHVTYIKDNEINNFDELYDYQPKLVFFTGSNYVGKQIENICVQKNIRYVTELGGMCPCYVSSIKNNKIYKRIVWSKFLNAGQTCVAINYILYNDSILNFVDNLIAEIKIQYPNVLEKNNIAKIINKKSFDRLTKIIKDNKNNILYGGKYCKKRLLIEPTIIEINPSKIKAYGELFGPILFVSKVNKDFNNIMNIINSIDNTPLAAYLYTNNQNEYDKFIRNINAGSYAINDSLAQILNHHLPFGGVYSSGTNSYHGFYSFKAMSLEKSMLINDNKYDNSLKYFNNNITLKTMKKKINFIKKIKK